MQDSCSICEARNERIAKVGHTSSIVVSSTGSAVTACAGILGNGLLTGASIVGRYVDTTKEGTTNPAKPGDTWNTRQGISSLMMKHVAFMVFPKNKTGYLDLAGKESCCSGDADDDNATHRSKHNRRGQWVFLGFFHEYSQINVRE